MYDQTAIRIARGDDSDRFAQLLQTTLEKLEQEQWNSRIFQFGHHGVMIVASRVYPVQPSWRDLDPWPVPEDLLPVADRFEWSSDFDMLDPVARNALDRVLDIIGPVPDDKILDSIEMAVPIALGHDSPRSLASVMEELQEYYEQHVASLDEADDHSYAHLLSAIIDQVKLLLARKMD